MSDNPVSEPTPQPPTPTGPTAAPKPSGSGPGIPSSPDSGTERAPRITESSGTSAGSPAAQSSSSEDEAGEGGAANRRRRGSRGGRNRSRPSGPRPEGDDTGAPRSAEGGSTATPPSAPSGSAVNGAGATPGSAPVTPSPRPQIGDSRPAPTPAAAAPAAGHTQGGPSGEQRQNSRNGSRRRRGGRGRGSGQGGQGGQGGSEPSAQTSRSGQNSQGGGQKQRQPQQGRRNGSAQAQRPVEAILGGDGPDLDEETLERRKGRERNGRPVGRYLMTVSVRPEATQIAVLEGRNLIEHFVSKPADDVAQIHGNIYLGKVQNVLPGMEAAFVDISTPKNAVLYRGDVQFDAEEIEGGGAARIEQILRAKQPILCQVTKNPIAHKGARLTQEVSLPGRFVVLIPNSSTYGISKRLADDERRRLRSILDKVKPPQHGVIVRTAAEGVTSEEISADVRRLLSQWEQIEQRAASVQAPALLYREPDMALRAIREEFNDDYRGVIIDDLSLYNEVHDYVASISPALADRVQFYDRSVEPLSIFERHHVHEQLHKALDRKVWLPSGGSLIIEHTEALTVIDVNTGKNVGSSNLEETVYRNNLEAAVEIAKQLRLRDVGGIIVIDFIDMEVKRNRDDVIKVFRDALARDKTRTQVFDISELGLVEMTRKRIGEGLLESFASACPECEGRGVSIDESLLG